MNPALDAVLQTSQTLLAEGATDPGSAWRSLTLATLGAGGMPQARIVVLRNHDRQRRIVEIHTDTRSAKVAELTDRPHASLHGWDPGRQIQLRLTGRTTLHTGPDADAAWAALRPQTRTTYHVRPGPGTAIAAPGDIAQASAAEARAVFCVIRLLYDTLDHLRLGREGHQRARFTWPDGVPQSQFLVP